MDRRTFLTWVWLGCLTSVSPAMVKAGTAGAKGELADDLVSQRLEPVVFYVALNGNDAWSGLQADPNTAKTDGPFATIQKARDAIRKLKREQGATLKQPVSVLLRGGTYFLSEPVIFTPEDSGTAKFPITYEAYRDEKPVISGGQPVTGWKQEGNIWKATLPASDKGSWDFLTLRVGNEWATRARYPNFEPKNPYKGGWLFAKNTSPSKTEVVVDPAKFPSWSDWSNAEINIYTNKGWWNALLPIERVEKDKHTLYINCPEEIGQGNRFFITNVREALDSPGEWCLNKTTGDVFYWPVQKDFQKLEIVAPKLAVIISLEGDIRKNKYVESINFKNLIFTDTTSPGRGYAWRMHAGIWLTGARKCEIEDCTFTHMVGYGILLKEGSSDNQILSNKMEKLGQGGVLLATSNLEGQELPSPSSNLIANNYIYECGLIYKGVAGVAILKGKNNRVAYNQISRMPRWGISIGYDSQDNIIEYNEVVDTSLETIDSGAIYTYGDSKQLTGNIIRFNFIRHSGGLSSTSEERFLFPHFTWGIYLDTYSSSTTVYGNIVVGTVWGGLCILGGKDNIIENNIFINGAEHQITVFALDEFMKGNIFRRNIVVFDNPNADLWFSYPSLWNRKRLAESNFNLYWHTGGLDIEKTGRVITPEGDFSKWQAAGFDRNSPIASPLFVAAEKGDFRLKADSPALKLGFQPIPIERIGPKGFNRSKETTVR
ncbi:right-handed parallel beta-helix repeat-containing protein [Microcoleus sp. FACHB-68]|uniref:right-handed parallel beta-helix repeat-containing protein n=1 Tax=Microcoleus sp. FACHB-68 TaxID=2692826 RepID=UPI001683477B|nr:right-handed parallel beta-helix repeat-containing protein [Microcoleus sp. FACHB-68]MBD1940403.1 right-handed parallel beta-helix repeat-containing protein [Microcoleus sp. FACHB-68]